MFACVKSTVSRIDWNPHEWILPEFVHHMCFISLRPANRSEMMVNACWHSFTHSSLCSHSILWWCCWLYISCSLTACDCQWLSLLVRAPVGLGLGWGLSWGPSSPLCFSVLVSLTSSFLKKKNLHLHKRTSSHQSTDTLPSICLFLPRLP